MQPEWSQLFEFFIYSFRSFVALFWGVFLFFFRRNSQQNLPLSIIFVLIGLLYLRNGFVRVPAIAEVDVYNPLSYFVLIFIAPFTVFYAWFSLGEKHRLQAYLLHFTPFVALLCLWITLRLSGAPRMPFCRSMNELSGYAGEYPWHTAFFILLVTVFIVQVFSYFSIALRRFLNVWQTYRIHQLSVRPLKLLIAMDFMFLFYPLAGVIFLSYSNEAHAGIVFNIFFSVMITAISVFNLNLTLPVKTKLEFIDNPAEKVKPVYDEVIDQNKVDADKILSDKIKSLFEEKELYRLPALTLQDIANELNTNRSYVSACINSRFGCNFKQLLMRYRLEAAKELMCNSSMDIQEISETVGFNNRASFYRAFREHVSNELSPVEWRAMKNEK